MTNTRLTYEAPGLYTHRNGHTVEAVTLDDNTAAWRLTYPDGVTTTTDTLTEARANVEADVMLDEAAR